MPPFTSQEVFCNLVQINLLMCEIVPKWEQTGKAFFELCKQREEELQAASWPRDALCQLVMLRAQLSEVGVLSWGSNPQTPSLRFVVYD